MVENSKYVIRIKLTDIVYGGIKNEKIKYIKATSRSFL